MFSFQIYSHICVFQNFASWHFDKLLCRFNFPHICHILLKILFSLLLCKPFSVIIFCIFHIFLMYLFLKKLSSWHFEKFFIIFHTVHWILDNSLFFLSSSIDDSNSIGHLVIKPLSFIPVLP